jgi:hypothetical protein
MGKAPSEFQVSNHFKRENDNPEITVVSTWNGSMTQETMAAYTKHFVASLPGKEKRNPKIMNLDISMVTSVGHSDVIIMT